MGDRYSSAKITKPVLTLRDGPDMTSVFRHWADHQVGAAAEGHGASRPAWHTGLSCMAGEAGRLAPNRYLFRFFANHKRTLRLVLKYGTYSRTTPKLPARESVGAPVNKNRCVVSKHVGNDQASNIQDRPAESTDAA